MNEKIEIGTEELDAASKNRLLVFILGIFVGLAVIIPGVSGSAIAMMLGLYTAMLYSLGNVLNDFKRCAKFLIPLLFGAVIGFGAGFVVIQKLFGEYLFQIVCLFVGFMIGAFPAISREIKGAKLTPVRAVLFPIGLLIPITIGAVSIILTLGNDASSATFTEFPAWRFAVYFPLGIAVSLTQIVPGLSATAILMAFGQFGPILNSVSLDYILENPAVLGLYASIGLGFAAGLVIISKLFTWILARWKISAFFVITGMACGSIVSMFINPDMYENYTAWINGAKSPVVPVIVGAVLLVLGFTSSYLLTRYENKKSAENK